MQSRPGKYHQGGSSVYSDSESDGPSNTTMLPTPMYRIGLSYNEECCFLIPANTPDCRLHFHAYGVLLFFCTY